MCGALFGGGGTTVTQQKVDPVPTVSDVSAKSAAGEREALNKQRRRRGQTANALSTDKGTILGSLTNAGDIASGIYQRQTLG